MSAINKTIVKKVVVGVILLLSLPLISVIFRVIFIYGNYVGTQARIISEYGICK